MAGFVDARPARLEVSAIELKLILNRDLPRRRYAVFNGPRGRIRPGNVNDNHVGCQGHPFTVDNRLAEALDEGVIGGFTWTAKIQNDAICIRP